MLVFVCVCLGNDYHPVHYVRCQFYAMAFSMEPMLQYVDKSLAHRIRSLENAHISRQNSIFCFRYCIPTVIKPSNQCIPSLQLLIFVYLAKNTQYRTLKSDIRHEIHCQHIDSTLDEVINAPLTQCELYYSNGEASVCR